MRAGVGVEGTTGQAVLLKGNTFPMPWRMACRRAQRTATHTRLALRRRRAGRQRKAALAREAAQACLEGEGAHRILGVDLREGEGEPLVAHSLKAEAQARAVVGAALVELCQFLILGRLALLASRLALHHQGAALRQLLREALLLGRQPTLLRGELLEVGSQLVDALSLLARALLQRLLRSGDRVEVLAQLRQVLCKAQHPRNSKAS